MESFLVVKLFNEGFNRLGGIREIAVTPPVDFFGFESLHKTFSERIVPGVSRPTHTDLDPVLFQQRNVIVARILPTAIGMMDQPRWRLSALHCFFQCLLCQITA